MENSNEIIVLLKSTNENLRRSSENLIKAVNLISEQNLVKTEIEHEIKILRKTYKDFENDYRSIYTILYQTIPDISLPSNYLQTEIPNSPAPNLNETENPVESQIIVYSPPNAYATENPVESQIIDSNQETFFSDSEKDMEEEIESDSEKLQPIGKLSEWDLNIMDIRLKRLSELSELSELKLEKFVELCDNFFFTASTYCQMLVAEQHCNTRDKKIYPEDFGGVAGGTKFSVHGLFFKYPVDTCIDKRNGIWLYGGYNHDDNGAAKASNHDLKGQTYCMMADENVRLNFPLLSLIDYQGFRLTVMTTLPITSQTLVYGSNDAGKTIKNNNDVHEELKNIAKRLNLRPHLVRPDIETALCGDIEIHNLTKENDNQPIYFALDLARVFPPTIPSNDICIGDPAGSIFFRMFRPEYILFLIIFFQLIYFWT
jgi:hypothetical protein